MRSTTFIATLLLTVILYLTGCTSTSKLQTEAPVATASAVPVYQPKLSSITIPVSVQVATLEEMLNRQFAGVLYNDTNLDDDDVAVTVSKNGRMSIRADKDKIYFSVPLNIYAKGRWKWDPCKLCPAIDKTEDTRFDMVINTESKIGLTEDYKLKTTTTGDFEWGNTKPVLELGPLKIGLARFVEPALRKQMATLTKQLDAELQKHIEVKKYVQQAWNMLQEPVKVNDDMNAWLQVLPQDVRVTPLQARNGTLAMRIGITSYINVTTDGKPKAQSLKKLPNLVLDTKLTDNIQVGLTADIPYTQASKMLQQQIANQTYKFDDGKSQLTVKDATISPGGDQLVLMLDVDGKTKAGLFTKKIVGKVYLRGTPYYDAATSSIKVRDVDYTLETKDKLLNTASWLAKNKFKDMIQQQVNIPVKDQLTDAHKSLQQALDKQGRVHESVMLKGKIQTIEPDNIYLTPTAIRAVITAKGNLTATIDKL
ncbi:DUF4403 family protein [Microvirga sp. STS03]|uniref:DUF4403 family protein n=1 Tax=Pontibacter TaxID=323449 RepID=UPI001B82C684|nr:DUF4403 family protein [Pontibacter populi]MBR0569842.1 DUF4403 family protein [Microvirga sp. STS03]